MTGEKKYADEVIESEKDYGISKGSISLSLAHTEVLSDDAYLKYILEVINND